MVFVLFISPLSMYALNCVGNLSAAMKRRIYHLPNLLYKTHVKVIFSVITLVEHTWVIVDIIYFENVAVLEWTMKTIGLLVFLTIFFVGREQFSSFHYLWNIVIWTLFLFIRFNSILEARCDDEFADSIISIDVTTARSSTPKEVEKAEKAEKAEDLEKLRQFQEFSLLADVIPNYQGNVDCRCQEFACNCCTPLKYGLIEEECKFLGSFTIRSCSSSLKCRSYFTVCTRFEYNPEYYSVDVFLFINDTVRSVFLPYSSCSWMAQYNSLGCFDFTHVTWFFIDSFATENPLASYSRHHCASNWVHLHP